MRSLSKWILVFAVATIMVTLGLREPAPAETADAGLSGPLMQMLVEESYNVKGVKPTGSLEQWLENAYGSYPRKLSTPSTGFTADLSAWKSRMSGLSNDARADREKELGEWAHAFVKKTIPKFSLQKGFEFEEMIDRGYRQCLLQSVLISAIMQSAGVDAGCAMVYRNPEGQWSNLGHVVTLERLSNGKDIIVDASHPEPFARQQGIFLHAKSGYAFVRPVYDSNGEILSYQRESDKGKLADSDLRYLDNDYLRSQFWFYRGERVQGGLIERPPTVAGLKRSAQLLTKSYNLCPRNPLTAYFLGRVNEELGNRELASRYLKHSVSLYRAFGWVPDSAEQALARVR